MTPTQKHEPVRSRNDAFAERTATRIWRENPSDTNPYIAQSASCHGYDLFELIKKRSFVEVFYLLFRGELPNQAEAEILEALMIALINPGPRHPATRAAMNTGIGKTEPVHILPIASAVLGGKHMGGGEIETIMRFLRRQQRLDAKDFFITLTGGSSKSTSPNVPDPNIPGFGQQHGGIDLMASAIAKHLSSLNGAGPALAWGNILAEHAKTQNVGWLTTGVAAAVFADLGFQPRAGGCLYQLLGAPGLIAHGIEMSNKPITAMPFVSDTNYVIER